MYSKPAIAAIMAAIVLTISTGARATPTDDACSLLTQSQVSAALGIPMGAGQAIPPNVPGRPAPTASKMCGWNEPGSDTPSAKRIVLAIMTTQSFATGKTPVQGITKAPVTGLGDEAYYITTPGLGTGLNVQKGNTALQVRIYGFPEDQIRTMEKALAENAVAKL